MLAGLEPLSDRMFYQLSNALDILYPLEVCFSACLDLLPRLVHTRSSKGQ